MAVSEKLKELVERMPDPDGRAMYCTNIDKEKIEAAVLEIQRGGKENVVGLIEMMGPPGSAEDVKPHYALHCVATLVLQMKDEKARQDFCQTVISQMTPERSKYVLAYLCQELQWAGRKEAVPALAKFLTDQELVDDAAMALVAIKDGAGDVLRAAYPSAKGRAKLVILHSLAALADAQAADLFKAGLKDEDREVRLAAGAGIAKIADGSAAQDLVKAASGEPGWERIQQTKQCLVLAEKLAAAGNKAAAKSIYQALKDANKDQPEAYIRESAERGLAAVG